MIGNILIGSFLGDSHFYGKQAIHFFTQTKTVTSSMASMVTVMVLQALHQVVMIVMIPMPLKNSPKPKPTTKMPMVMATEMPTFPHKRVHSSMVLSRMRMTAMIPMRLYLLMHRRSVMVLTTIAMETSTMRILR